MAATGPEGGAGRRRDPFPDGTGADGTARGTSSREAPPVDDGEEEAHGLTSLWRTAFSGGFLLSIVSVLEKGLGLFLLPLYTRYLTPADYGQVEILMVSVTLTNIVLGQGLPPALTRQLNYVHADDRGRQRVAAGSAIGYVALAWIVFLGLIAVASEGLSGVLLGDVGYAHLVLVGGLLAAFRGVESLQNAVFLSRDRVPALVTASSIQFVVKVILNIWFVVVLEWGFPGIVWSHLAGDLLVTGLKGWMIRNDVSWTLDTEELRSLLAYGIPLISSSVSLQVLWMSDRYVLNYLRPQEELGLYAVSNKFSAGFFSAVVAPFIALWEAIGLRLARTDGGRREIARFANIYLYLGGALCLGGLYFIEPVVRIVVAPVYFPAHAAVGILMAGVLLFGFGELFKVGLRVAGSAAVISIVGMVAAVANVGLNFLLIPRFGFMGAALATVLSYALFAAANAMAAQRCFPLSYDWGRLSLICGLLLVACLAQPLLTPLGVWDRASLGLTLLLLYLAAAPVLLGSEALRFVGTWLGRFRRLGWLGGTAN